jgi:hypothetical protein
MKHYLKGKLLGVAALVLGLTVATIATPVNAVAAYTPQGVCGGGYYVQRSHKLKGATVYQLYNGSSNCVVTIKTSSVGKATRTTAGLLVKGSKHWSYDVGDYKYYAGPVKLKSKGKCVKYFGYHGGTNYTSPWGNCG